MTQVFQTKVIVCLKHDAGRIKISTYATSLDEAIEKVLKSENASKSAVLYAKVAPMTISDIKNYVVNAPHFFDRSSMRHFGQSMKDFSVSRFGDDSFKISAPSRMSGRVVGTTERIYNAFTREFNY